MNEINIEIKTFSENLINEVLTLILNIQQNEFNISIKLEDQPDLFEIENFYRKNGGEFWVAMINKEVVGTIAMLRINDIGVIRKMFVKKEFRGKNTGVAQCLINTLINYCYKNNLQSLYLGTIDKYKAAQKFYEKNKFIKIDKSLLPNEFPVMLVDNVFYKRILVC